MPPKKNKKKQHLLPRLIVGIFMAIAVAQTVATIGAFSSPEMASAASDKIVFVPQVDIPGMKAITFGDSTRPIAEYIKAIYTYAVGAVGILATVMLMIGGLRWILAAGNPSSVSEAKDIIIASISGMVLVLTSYLVLNQVNPALTDLSKNITKIQSVAKKEDTATADTKNCSWVANQSVSLGTETTGGTGTIKCETGQLLGADTDCTTKQTDKNSSCCCKYEATPSCTWKTTTCQSGETSYDYSLLSTTKDENAVKKCGSSVGSNQFCCCGGSSCPTCVNLKSLGIECSSIASICETDKDLANKLKEAYNDRGGLNWEITSGVRTNKESEGSNHAKGTAVDIWIANVGTDLSIAQNLYTSLSKHLGTGNVHLECKVCLPNTTCTNNKDCCVDYPGTNCRWISWADGVHFHVDK